jgi:C4-dicarboxylate-specific signal transduction histidine kinase
MGELTASLAHEVNQPIAAAATNAEACLRWLTGDAQRLRCQVGLLIQLFKIL